MDKIQESEGPLGIRERRRGNVLNLAIIVIVIIAVCVIAYLFTAGPIDEGFPPIGKWSDVRDPNPTETSVEFGTVVPEVQPMDLELVLVLNGTMEGRYIFTSNGDGELTFSSGENVGTLTYVDLKDDEWVDYGEMIRLSNLAPDSVYTLIMIWSPTGDYITSTSFSTPAG